MPNKNPLNRQSYISVETYRKTGDPVSTPVWFAQNEATGRVYIWTESDSGKAKRIRNNPSVRLAPSDSRGNPKGAYMSGKAIITPEDSDEHTLGIHLINKKYGFMKMIFGLIMGNKKPHCIIAIELTG